MSYSKTKWGYLLKASMKMKASPQHFLHCTLPDSRWGDTLTVINSNYKVLLECIVKPWPSHKGVHCCTVLTVVILFLLMYGSIKTKCWIKLENNFNKERGGCLIMAMSADAYWVGHVCVELSICEPNWAFLCRTMHFAVEPGFFVSKEC